MPSAVGAAQKNGRRFACHTVAEVKALWLLRQAVRSPGRLAGTEVEDRLPCPAGQMAESDIMSGLPTGTEAAR